MKKLRRANNSFKKRGKVAEKFISDRSCRGWLVGEADKELSYMFQMMNGARIDVGLGAASIVSAAYWVSLEYAHERPQGRKLSSKVVIVLKHLAPAVMAVRAL
jgi:alkylation response protein AidB-like acyl-CoA dehydrogenase